MAEASLQLQSHSQEAKKESHGSKQHFSLTQCTFTSTHSIYINQMNTHTHSLLHSHKHTQHTVGEAKVQNNKIYFDITWGE